MTVFAPGTWPEMARHPEKSGGKRNGSSKQHPIVDADGHLFEPDSLGGQYLDARFHSAGPGGYPATRRELL